MLFPNLYDFLSSADPNKDILRNISIQTIWIPLTYTVWAKHTDILQNDFFNVPQKKESHAGEVWTTWGQRMTELSSLGELSL